MKSLKTILYWYLIAFPNTYRFQIECPWLQFHHLYSLKIIFHYCRDVAALRGLNTLMASVSLSRWRFERLHHQSARLDRLGRYLRKMRFRHLRFDFIKRQNSTSSGVRSDSAATEHTGCSLQLAVSVDIHSDSKVEGVRLDHQNLIWRMQL